MKAAMVVTWTGVRPGRERAGLDYARKVDDYFGKFAADGKCTWPKWYFTENGGGIWVVEGEVEDLLLINATPEARKFTMQGALYNEGWTNGICMTDRDETFRQYEAVLDEMKL